MGEEHHRGISTDSLTFRWRDTCRLTRLDEKADARRDGRVGLNCLPMKIKHSCSVVSTSSIAAAGGFTLGLDLGDRKHQLCVLNSAGEVVREGSLPNTRPALSQLLAEFAGATVAMEAGTHSPWVSRFLTELGARVIVANPRKLHAISRHERKSDRRDAMMLARLARVDPALLAPIEHGSAQAQQDLLGLKLRDALVRTRVNLINTVRFTRAWGIRCAIPPASRSTSRWWRTCPHSVCRSSNRCSRYWR